LYFFKKIGDLDFSANVILGFSLFFLCSHLLTANKEYFAFHLVWAGCFPAFAANLLPKKETIIWTVVSTCSLCGVLLLRHLDFELPLYSITGKRAISSSLFSLIMSIIFMYTMVRNFREKEKTFMDRNDEIEERKKHLEMAITYNIANYNNSIRLIAEEIEKTEKDQRLKDFAGKILEKLEYSESIVRNIRKESESLEQLTQELQPEKMDLYETLKEVRDLYQGRLKEKNLSLSIENEDKPPQEGYLIWADPSSLATPILSNILSNAINYSKESYSIHCKLRVYDDWGVLLEIRDMGPGMSKTKVESILNPLSIHKTPEDADSKILNLATVKSYLEMQGGRLYIDSRPIELYPESHGTTVRIYFRRFYASKNQLVS
jgi:signal transduction histidine kinase